MTLALLQRFNFYSPPDPSYGRINMPFSHDELNIRNNKQYTVTDRKAYYDPSLPVYSSTTNQNNWVWYQVGNYINNRYGKIKLLFKEPVCHYTYRRKKGRFYHVPRWFILS